MYESRVREVEYASFTPLVMSATGGMAKQATAFHMHLASLLANKREASQMYIVFSLLHSAIQCIQGAHILPIVDQTGVPW